MKDIRILACPAEQSVIAWSTVQRIVACAPTQTLCSFEPNHPIIGKRAEQFAIIAERATNLHAPGKQLIKGQHRPINKLESLNSMWTKHVIRKKPMEVQGIILAPDMERQITMAARASVLQTQTLQINPCAESDRVSFLRTYHIVDKIDPIANVKEIRILPNPASQHIVSGSASNQIIALAGFDEIDMTRTV